MTLDSWNSSHTHLLAPCALSAALCIAATVVAIEPSHAQTRVRKEQKRLDAEARSAVKRGDYEVAIDLLERSLELGELNITYLNLGRAYFHADLCTESIHAYSRVPFAPQVDNPPPEAIAKTLSRFEAETFDRCASPVTIDCLDGVERVNIDDSPAQCGSIIELKPGPHTVTFDFGNQSLTQRFRLEPTQEFTLILPEDGVAPVELGNNSSNPIDTNNTPTPPPSDTDSGALTVLAWTTGGLGLIALGVAGGLFVVNQNDIQAAGKVEATDEGLIEYNRLVTDIENRDITIAVSLGVGGALLLTSIILFIVDGNSKPSATTMGGDIDVQLRLLPNGALGLTW